MRWNDNAPPRRPRTPGTTVILVEARNRAEAIGRAATLPWWSRVASRTPQPVRGRWAFEVLR